MKICKWLGVILIAVLSVASIKENIATAEENSDIISLAQVAVEAWLPLVDSGKYHESWEASSEPFRVQTSEEAWEGVLKKVREPFGKLITRRLEKKKYVTSIPGAPDGEYVVFRFSTSFGNKKAAIETVTTRLDPDEHWRVIGYFLQ